MNPKDTLNCLELGWKKYLKNRGHHIYRIDAYLPMIRSRNHKKNKYRWLLIVGHGLKRTLSKPELSNVRQNLKQARIHKEAAYLVVGFSQEPRHVVILPAESALKAGYIRSDKGGIDWEDE